MIDDKENTPEGVADADAQDQPMEIGIQTDPVPFVICPGCAVEIDTEGIPSFTEIACPHCAARLTVPAQLGNFRLLSVIGAGGMGAVFLAQDDTLNRRVAIKVMLGSLGADPAVLETFRREAQSAARPARRGTSGGCASRCSSPRARCSSASRKCFRNGSTTRPCRYGSALHRFWRCSPGW